MSDLLAGQPDWVLLAGAGAILLLGGMLGRWSKRAVTIGLGPATRQLARIADACEKRPAR